MPRLKNVLHVDRLKAKLNSISQICDHNSFVNFIRDEYLVLDYNGNCVLKGCRSVNDCDTLIQTEICHNVTINNTDL